MNLIILLMFIFIGVTKSGYAWRINSFCGNVENGPNNVDCVDVKITKMEENLRKSGIFHFSPLPDGTRCRQNGDKEPDRRLFNLF